MTIAADEIALYHVGIVVHDLEAVAERYRQLLGVPRWHFFEAPLPAVPWNPQLTDARLQVGYGRAGGLTIELLRTIEGESVLSAFERERGEGVQHLGFWVPDMQKVVAEVLRQGATVTWATLASDGSATVQVTSANPPPIAVAALDRDGLCFVEPGLGGVQIEYCGRMDADFVREVIGENFENVVTLPPWS
jgi:catechol 2,3-dioxygenase-like lactoylglutathione lyase family enzyme